MSTWNLTGLELETVGSRPVGARKSPPTLIVVMADQPSQVTSPYGSWDSWLGASTRAIYIYKNLKKTASHNFPFIYLTCFWVGEWGCRPSHPSDRLATRRQRWRGPCMQMQMQFASTRANVLLGSQAIPQSARPRVHYNHDDALLASCILIRLWWCTTTTTTTTNNFPTIERGRTDRPRVIDGPLEFEE